LVPVETWGSANRLFSVCGVDAYAERSIRKIRMNDTQLYIHDILLTSAMYRYTTRNVHLHGQLSLYLNRDTTTFSTATYILRRTSPLAPPSYLLSPTQSTVNHAHALATSPTSRRRRGPNLDNRGMKLFIIAAKHCIATSAV